MNVQGDLNEHKKKTVGVMITELEVRNRLLQNFRLSKPNLVPSKHITRLKAIVRF